jgi:diguanylate cyclase (GGDEF)-like protein
MPPMRYCARQRAYLLKNVRAQDFVCRFGGEEFVIILPTAGRDGAHARAERLRSKMRELNIMNRGKSLGMVTFSVAIFCGRGGIPRTPDVAQRFDGCR